MFANFMLPFHCFGRLVKSLTKLRPINFKLGTNSFEVVGDAPKIIRTIYPRVIVRLVEFLEQGTDSAELRPGNGVGEAFNEFAETTEIFRSGEILSKVVDCGIKDRTNGSLAPLRFDGLQENHEVIFVRTVLQYLLL